MTPTPRKLSDEELREIQNRVKDGILVSPRTDGQKLLAHIAALEAEWPKCRHGHPIRISGGSFLAKWMSRSCEYCGCFEGLGDTPDAALAAFRAANRKTELGGDER